HFNYQPRPNSSPHSLFARRGNLVKTHKRILTRFPSLGVTRGKLLSRACAIHSLSARAEIVESLLWAAARDRDTAPDGTVLFVNKKNRKTDAASEGNANIVCKCRAARRKAKPNFRRMLRILKLPAAQFFVRAPWEILSKRASAF
ncbi:hypothetical protein, partial [uncultured Rikenella sp.]